MKNKTNIVSNKTVKVNKFLIKEAKKFVGENKPFPNLSQFANYIFRNELEKRGVKI